MKLLALYIKKHHECFENLCLNFTSDFEVSYNNDTLTINTKENNHKNFYGDFVSDISVIIGKNGTGKTSLLNLIGYRMQERIKMITFSGKEIVDKYFLVYYISEQTYYIEFMGNDFVFQNAEIDMNKDYAFSCFIKKEGNIYKEIPIDENLDSQLKIGRVIYIPDNMKKTFVSSTYLPGSSNRWMLKRSKSDDISWEHWYSAYVCLYENKIVSSDKLRLKFLLNAFNNNIESIEFHLLSEVTDSTITMDGILHTPETFNDCILHLISISITFLLNAVKIDDEMIHDFYKRWYHKSFEISADNISNIFEELEIILYKCKATKIGKYIYESVSLYKNFYSSMMEIKDNIICGPDEFILVLDGAKKNNAVCTFLSCYDLLSNYLKMPLIDEDSFLEITSDLEEYVLDEDLKKCFRHTVDDIVPLISQGENKIITMFGAMLFELQKRVNRISIGSLNYDLNYIFLIDEVENGMHLEWSRLFIFQIVNSLKIILKNDNSSSLLDSIIDRLQIQLIMSTHSPFLTSDLLQSCVIKLDKSTETGLVVQAKNNRLFAQNIQTIISDDFFIDKYCGEYALKKIQEIIDIIRKGRIDTQQADKLMLIIEEIGDPIIRNKLKQMIHIHIKLQ